MVAYLVIFDELSLWEVPVVAVFGHLVEVVYAQGFGEHVGKGGPILQYLRP